MDKREIWKLALDLFSSASKCNGVVNDEFVECMERVLDLEEDEILIFYGYYR